MPDHSPVTRESYAEALANLRGHALSEVAYFGFSWFGSDWDEGSYHRASMGVELVRDDGRRFFAGWGDAFGHFGLELVDAAASEILHNQPERRDFSHHRWWRPFIHAPMAATAIWQSGHNDSDESAPVALELSTDDHRVWVVSAQKEEGLDARYLLGLDEVLVTADRSFAVDLGLIPDVR
jgi:hypothetical protein